MKKTRKGFTLVELLIVIAILGTLSAMMTSSTGNATVRAKVAQIVSNIEACKIAAAVFYADNYDSKDLKMSDTTAETVLAANIPTYKDFENGNITIKALTDDNYKGRDNWTVEVDFTNDADRTRLAELLKNTRGYSGSYNVPATGTEGQDGYVEAHDVDFVTDGKFNINITTGIMSKADSE